MDLVARRLRSEALDVLLMEFRRLSESAGGCDTFTFTT